MAIPITGTFKPLGDFPLVEAVDVQMPDGSKLSDFKPEVNLTEEQLAALKGDKGDPGEPGNDGFSPSVKVMLTISGGKTKATITATDKDGTTNATISDGADGKGVYIYDSSVVKNSYGQYPDTAVTIPDGCTLSVGDLLLDSEGNVYQVTSKGSETFNRALLFNIGVDEETIAEEVKGYIDSLFVPLTQEEYDALETVDPNKYYMIVG